MIDSDLVPWIFAGIMSSGLAFLLISIFLGDVGDLDLDLDVDLDLDLDGALDGALGDAGNGAESRNLGCMVIAAFMTGFGSVGLTGSLMGWSVPYSLLVALVFGLIFGRSTMAVLNFVMRQQYSDLLTKESLIGTFARITVDVPAGKVGEALVEGESYIKYPVRAESDAVELRKGDYVEIVAVEGGTIHVKKKRG